MIENPIRAIIEILHKNEAISENKNDQNDVFVFIFSMAGLKSSEFLFTWSIAYSIYNKSLVF